MREATRDRLTAASLARLTAPDTDAETFRAHARFALDDLPALTTRPDQIKQLRQTILNLAVRGKLVAQDANDEPASELLKRIAAEKARLVKAGTLKAERKMKEPTSPIELFELPRGWTWTRLQSICISISDGDHQPPPKSETGVPFLVIGDVRTEKQSTTTPSAGCRTNTSTASTPYESLSLATCSIRLSDHSEFRCQFEATIRSAYRDTSVFCDRQSQSIYTQSPCF